MNIPWLYEGVTTVILGQGFPSGMHSANTGASAIHGHNVLPGGAGGRSTRLGQRILVVYKV